MAPASANLRRSATLCVSVLLLWLVHAADADETKSALSCRDGGVNTVGDQTKLSCDVASAVWTSHYSAAPSSSWFTWSPLSTLLSADLLSVFSWLALFLSDLAVSTGADRIFCTGAKHWRQSRNRRSRARRVGPERDGKLRRAEGWDMWGTPWSFPSMGCVWHARYILYVNVDISVFLRILEGEMVTWHL